METSFRDDKQGLGLTTRSKQRLAAQQVVVYLGIPAHNVLVRSCSWLASHLPRYGLLRLVRLVVVAELYDTRDRAGRGSSASQAQATPAVGEIGGQLVPSLIGQQGQHRLQVATWQGQQSAQQEAHLGHAETQGGGRREVGC